MVVALFGFVVVSLRGFCLMISALLAYVGLNLLLTWYFVLFVIL